MIISFEFFTFQLGIWREMGHHFSSSLFWFCITFCCKFWEFLESLNACGKVGRILCKKPRRSLGWHTRLSLYLQVPCRQKTCQDYRVQNIVSKSKNNSGLIIFYTCFVCFFFGNSQYLPLGKEGQRELQLQLNNMLLHQNHQLITTCYFIKCNAS